MFSPFSKFFRSREAKQAAILVNKGIGYLQGNLQHKALFQFQQAVEINPEKVAEMLNAEFEKCYKRGDDELAISIGRIVLRIRENDYELANKLGNSARRMKQYKEANDFYRQAFRINRKYEIAFYNLAASMGRIPRYNNDVKILVDKFAHLATYVLPNYKLDTKYLENIILAIKEEIQEEESEGGMQEALEPTYLEISDRIRSRIKEVGKQKASPRQKKIFESEVFNLGLFALSRKDSKLALKCFLQLKSRNSQLQYLDMVTILAMDMESPSKKLVQDMMVLLGADKTNRYINVNLGLMFKRQGKRILSYKYLATTALLLEKTGGIYCRKELIKMADQEMELGNLKKALHIYQLIDSEIANVKVRANMGQIMLYQSRYSEALPIYQSVLEIDENNTNAKQKLLEIHDYFIEKGEDLIDVKRYSTAVPYFEQALSATRLPQSVKKLADLHKVMMDVNRAEELYIEYNKLTREKEKTDFENARSEYINQGKKALETRDLAKATELFEKAFELKVDKDVFVFLAHIYKMQKKTTELQKLLDRWKKKINEEGISFDDI